MKKLTILLPLVAILTGCASMQSVSDSDLQLIFDTAITKIRERLAEKSEEIPTPPTPGTTPVEVDPPPLTIAADEVDYSSLRWEFGGFNGRGAVPSPETRISNLAISGKNMSFTFAAGSCVTLGAKNASDTGVVMVCLFAKDASGTWRGGKFDWIADNRGARRDLNHITGSTPYSNWSSSWIPNPADAAFVLVSTTGRRCNVIKSTWRR